MSYIIIYSASFLSQQGPDFDEHLHSHPTHRMVHFAPFLYCTSKSFIMPWSPSCSYQSESSVFRAWRAIPGNELRPSEMGIRFLLKGFSWASRTEQIWKGAWLRQESRPMLETLLAPSQLEFATLMHFPIMLSLKLYEIFTMGNLCFVGVLPTQLWAPIIQLCVPSPHIVIAHWHASCEALYQGISLHCLI